MSCLLDSSGTPPSISIDWPEGRKTFFRPPLFRDKTRGLGGTCGHGTGHDRGVLLLWGITAAALQAGKMEPTVADLVNRPTVAGKKDGGMAWKHKRKRRELPGL